MGSEMCIRDRVQIEHELGDKNAASSYAMLLRANYPDAPETKLLLESDIQ